MGCGLCKIRALLVKSVGAIAVPNLLMMTKTVSLVREFRRYSEVDDLDAMAKQFHNDRIGLKWEQLTKPVVVILGSPGIGKTTEFRLRATEMAENAFTLFVPLCQIDGDSWNIDPIEEARLEKWEANASGKGIFFLDSIDEARLSDPNDFRKALLGVHRRLKKQLHRTQIFLSSRFYDWAVPEVRDAVHSLLTQPLCSAQYVISNQNDFASGYAVLPQVEEVEPLVLEPLSRTEQVKLSRHFNVINESDFWDAVHGGNYSAMAVSPRDLAWLVEYWNSNQKLSSYTELMRAHVERRLSEENESYSDRVATLSADRAQSGAELVAMAMEVSATKDISIKVTSNRASLNATELLREWNSQEIKRLLGTAAFDLSSFQCFTFNHRSTREYLFGRWVAARRAGGVPLERLMRLFVREQYGKSVLIPARRYGLSWACSLDHEIRRWVATKHPEVFVFDGDPSRWDAPTAELAFKGYLTKLSQGWHRDWFNSGAEMARVCAALRPTFLPSMLVHFSENDAACGTVLTYIYQGEVAGCNAEIQRILEKTSPTGYIYRQAVTALGKVGTQEQLSDLKTKLLAGDFAKNNKLIAELLEAIGLRRFSLDELKNLISQAEPEEGIGGPMARAFGEVLSEESEFEIALLALQALLESLPSRLDPVRASEMLQPPWIYAAFSDVFERALELFPGTEVDIGVCVSAAWEAERLRRTNYAPLDEFKKVKVLIARNDVLRWHLLNEVALRDEVKGRSSLFHDVCLVGLEKEDLEEVVSKANLTTLPAEVNRAWFKAGVRLVGLCYEASLKSEALQRFIVPPYEEERSTYILGFQEQEGKFSGEHQAYLAEQEEEKLERARQKELDIELITNELPAIENAEYNALLKLTQYILHDLRSKFFEEVDLDEVAEKFGRHIADALAVGLIKHFKGYDVDDPSNYPDGSVPWRLLLATAGSQILVARRSALDVSDISKIARLEVWYPNGPSSTFDSVLPGNEAAIVEALEQWVLREAETEQAGKAAHSAIRFLLGAPHEIQRPLLNKLKGAVVSDDVTHPMLRKGIWDAMAELNILSASERATLASERVKDSGSSEVIDIGWLRRWLYSAPEDAWSWFKARVESANDGGQSLVTQFSENIGNLEAALAIDGDERLNLLVEIYALFRPYAKNLDDAFPFRTSTVESLVGRIPNIVKKVPSEGANRALAKLAEIEPDHSTSQWLWSEQLGHASQVAEVEALTSFDQVQALIDGFETEANSADQLLQQVLARLGEIKRGVEEGPFSDRNLFRPKMREKDVQLWLAARLSERVPLARFNVQREEEVDDDKKTDIQLSTSNKYVVCVEIKPLDSDGRYSAAELVDTLRTQILGQYLKGYNSSHGVLVLFRLEERTWDVNDKRRQKFEELIAYLRGQAQLIIEEHNRTPGVVPVRALEVFDIKCYR